VLLHVCHRKEKGGKPAMQDVKSMKAMKTKVLLPQPAFIAET
jgi:hypothetical protein